MRFQVNRALSVQRNESDDTLHIGALPPLAKIVRNPPDFLESLILEFIKGTEPEQAIARVTRRFGGDRFAEIVEAAADLVKLGVIVPMVVGAPRYDRHHLYFSLYGVGPKDYDERLRALRVGVIGMGGLGSTLSMLLAAAGVGELVVSDSDRLEVSNLTRSVLYRETDIGEKKVAAAADQIERLNPSTRVITVDSAFAGGFLIDDHFAECDVLALTADRPADVHDWIDEAARRRGIPYITAGYIETRAAVGPFVIPGETSCYGCFQRGRETPSREINTKFQAASYGPLNMLSASIAANEILRYALGLPPKTRNCWAFFDLAALDLELVPAPPDPRCTCGAAQRREVEGVPDPFPLLAKLYESERERASLNRELVDDLIVGRIPFGSRVLDLGAGIGTLARAAAERKCDVVAVERSPEMLEVFRSRTPAALEERITIIEADVERAVWPAGPYNAILLVLVLDHLLDPGPVLARCRGTLSEGGRIQIVLPHPFKDSGGWQLAEGGRTEWVLNDYFREGRQEKVRLDSRGAQTPIKLATWKHTLQGWMEQIAAARLAVTRIDEPRADPSKRHINAQINLAHAVPYFLVLECVAAPDGCDVG